MNFRELLQQDLRSKWIDGLMSAIFLWLIILLNEALISPLQSWAGLPGLLIYLLGLLAISLFCLEHALVTRHAENTRAWYGAAGGLLAWAVTALIGRLWQTESTGVAGLLTLLMIILIVATLWRRALPLGARFFAMAYILNWSVVLLYEMLRSGALLSPILKLAYTSFGFFAALGIIGLIAWLFFRSERRLQRVYIALTLCTLSVLLFYFYRLPLP